MDENKNSPNYYADDFSTLINKELGLYTFRFESEAAGFNVIVTVPTRAVDDFVKDYIEKRKRDEN